jgi:flagellar biosynthesis component FlhA
VASNIVFGEAMLNLLIIIAFLMVFLAGMTAFISLLANAGGYTSHEHEIKREKKEKNKMEKKRRKDAKKNRKNLVKRIKNMTVEQFDAYYETLVNIYGRECFHKEFAKRYVRLLKGVSEEETAETTQRNSRKK